MTGPSGAAVRVTEFTDPGCVWSWSSEGTIRWLRRRYAGQVDWRRVYGIQVDDLTRTHPGRDPIADAEAFRQEWLEVAAHTGAPIAERLAWMHRSTHPASAAALAAEEQGTAVGDAVLRRLRERAYVDGIPADTPERVAAALGGIDGLDLPLLLERAASADLSSTLDEHWARTREPLPEVVGKTGTGPNPGAAKPDGEHLRYGFPTLVVDGPGGRRALSGWYPAQQFADEIEAAGNGALVAELRPLDPVDALVRYRSLTEAELRLLTGGDAAPAGAVRLDTATAPLWLHPDEARARRLPATEEIGA